MRCIRHADIRTIDGSCVATIGTFDGVHVGHQKVLSSLREKADELNLPSVVICFEPQPKEFFLKESAPKRITPFRDRMECFKACGVDYIVCLQFNQYLRSLSAEAFVLEILVNALSVRYLVVGDDFRFGNDRQGDYGLLEKMGETHNFQVDHTETLLVDNQRVSSSHIRQLTQAHKFEKVQSFLGRPYRLAGRVHHGAKNGRKLGFPTVNIPLKVDVVVSGVYIVKVHFPSKYYYGVANVGVRPTVCGKRRLLEVHLLNFDANVYGQHIHVEFLEHLRDEIKFESFEQLATQINKDKQAGLNWMTAQIGNGIE